MNITLKTELYQTVASTRFLEYAAFEDMTEKYIERIYNSLISKLSFRASLSALSIDFKQGRPEARSSLIVWYENIFEKGLALSIRHIVLNSLAKAWQCDL